MNVELKESCAHAVCGCAVAPGDEFCSEHCRTHPDESSCRCGHAHCAEHDPADGEENV